MDRMTCRSLSMKLRLPLSLSHTCTHEFQCLVCKTSTSKYLETSRNIWKHQRGAVSGFLPLMDPGWPKSEVFMPARAQGLGAPWWVLALVGCSGIQRPSLMAR